MLEINNKVALVVCSNGKAKEDKVKLDNYDLATKTHTVTLLDENEQPYLFSKKSELSDEVEYGMYKNGEIVPLDEKQYNFEVENMGNSGVEKFFNRLFG